MRSLKKGGFSFAFTYMFIDESQDFDENFFELCELVTEKNIYVAGGKLKESTKSVTPIVFNFYYGLKRPDALDIYKASS